MRFDRFQYVMIETSLARSLEPSCPSDAVATSCPKCCSNIAREVLASSLSSTTRIRRRRAAGVYW